MIDKSNGRIIVNDKTTIGTDSSLEEILNLNLGESRNQGNHNNGWTWLQERNVSLDNKYFILNFLFLDNRLREIHFVVNDLRFESESWNDWSELHELSNLEKYKDWIKNELGTETDFDWGSVWASYDSKGGSSSIGIRYK